jgi:hypothetical protein
MRGNPLLKRKVRNMSRVLISSLVVGLAFVSWAGVRHTSAAQLAPCSGSWLVHLNVEGRDVSEDDLLAFTADGTVTLYGPPVLPALPGQGEVPLSASTGLGVWEPMENGDCAFEVVRVLADDDGVGVGTLDVRATATIDSTAGSIDGQFTYTRATGFGQTAASGSGTITGTPIDGPLLWLTPTSGTASAGG